MLKPVTILALDDDAATLAEAVQQRVAAAHGLEDLVQFRSLSERSREEGGASAPGEGRHSTPITFVSCRTTTPASAAVFINSSSNFARVT